MKGYIYIDKEFASHRKLIEELLSSDCFRESGYGIRMNISKQELQDKWICLGYDFDEEDPVMVFASVLNSLGYSPQDVCFDGNTNYSDLKKIKANEDVKLNSIFCLPEQLDTDIDRLYGVGVIRSSDNNVLKLPPNRPIKCDEEISWNSILPKDYWNSIIVADCYILKDKMTIDRNLFPILDKGCSKSPNVPIQITIFTQFLKDDRPTMWSGAYDYIKSKYPKANLEIIDVKNASKEIHDRDILTNHFYMHFPGGTDLLNAWGRATKRTKIITYKYPQFLDNAKDDYEAFCESVRQYREDYKDIRCDKKQFKNRLIY